MRFNLLIIIIGFGFASGPNGFADDSGLVAYWPLDEGEGTLAQDLSGKGNAGKISGEITWEKTERGMALRFNGKNTSVRIPNNPTWNIGRGALTLCLWVKVMDNKRGYLFEHYFGGGPAGMAAAWTAGRRGHDVTLFETAGELGGQVRRAPQLPLSLELGSVVRNLARQVEIAGVDVSLNVHATPSHVEELEADEVILATGSHPYIPSTIPRHEKARVFTLPEAMAHPAALGDSVLLVDNDGHQRGASAAGWLLGLGKKLKIVTEFTHVGCHFEFAMLHFRLYELLHRHEITVMPNYRVEEIHADTVDVADNYAGCRRTLSGHDSVIMIYPQIANTDLETSLRKTFPHLHRVGDCLSVRNIEIAVYWGARLGSQL